MLSAGELNYFCENKGCCCAQENLTTNHPNIARLFPEARTKRRTMAKKMRTWEIFCAQKYHPAATHAPVNAAAAAAELLLTNLKPQETRGLKKIISSTRVTGNPKLLAQKHRAPTHTGQKRISELLALYLEMFSHYFSWPWASPDEDEEANLWIGAKKESSPHQVFIYCKEQVAATKLQWVSNILSVVLNFIEVATITRGQ